MSQSQWVRNTTQASFDADVIQLSESVPVLVDFWAPWCGPCQMLIPVLERLAEEYTGKFVVAKINTDEQIDLARAHQIRSLPTVRLVVKGAIVEEFIGLQSEGAIRKLLEAHLA